MRRAGLLALGAALGAAGVLVLPARAQAPGDPVVTSLTLFAGTRDGLFRSGDWGGTWTRVEGASSGASLAGIGAVHAVSARGMLVMAAGSGGLFSSTDFGVTWRRLLEEPVLSVLTSRYFEADPVIFAGTPGGLLRSRNGGYSFLPTTVRETKVLRLEWPGPALLVATGRGVSLSLDAAETFLAGDGAGLPPREVRSLAVSSYFALDPVAFAGTADNGVYRSRDGGRTWSASGLPGRVVNDLVWLGPFLYAATDQGVMRSQDAGQNWAPLGEGLEGRTVTALLFPHAPDSGAEAFAATDAGVFRTTDGGEHWTLRGRIENPPTCLATFPPPEKAAPRRRRR